jgi:predicted CXXCH cytochrome family protein
MNKVLAHIIAVFFLLFTVTAFAAILDTKHNLTSSGGSTKTTDATATLCGLCHLPHGGSAAVATLPLWARATSSAAYTVYGGGSTLAGTSIAQPGTYSKTCLSCHDGTIGLATVVKNGVSRVYPMTTTLPGGLTAGGAFQATNIDPTTGYSPHIGTDLQNDHPVGFEFPVAGYGAGGGVPGISLLVQNSGVIGQAELVGDSTGSSYPVFQYASGAIQLNVFECPTCHDPHRENTGTTQTKFLRAPNASLCQDCHNTK